MEGNRDEAEKAMAEAEELYKANDLTAAYRLADKAFQLYPSLPYIRNLLHSLHILRVYSNGPLFGPAGHWHAIVGSRCGDDVNTIKRQYKKMCILIHPDKNPSAPAAEAFKVLNMAWEALSSSASDSKPASASGFDWGAPSSSFFSNGRANAQSKSNPASGHGFYTGAPGHGFYTGARTSTANANADANAQSGASGYWANAGHSGANAQAEPGPYPGCRTSSARTGGNARAQSNPDNTSGSGHYSGTGTSSTHCGANAKARSKPNRTPGSSTTYSGFGADAQAQAGPTPGPGFKSGTHANSDGHGSNSKRDADQASGSRPNATQNCPQCNRVCWRLDSSTSKCAFCNLTMVRDRKNGGFRVVLKMDWGSVSVEGSSSVTIMQASPVETRNGHNIQVHLS